MKFIELVRISLGVGLREFGRLINVSHQLLGFWRDGAPKMRDFMVALCKIRKVSGKSWNQFGKMLDEEFLPKDKK